MIAGSFVHGYRLGHYTDVTTGHVHVHQCMTPSVEVDLNDPDIAEMVMKFRKPHHAQ